MFAGKPGHYGPSAFPVYRPLDPGTVCQCIVLLFILGTLFLLDIVTTQIILHMGGIELNPFMAGIVNYPAFHLVIKALLFLVIIPVSLVAEQRLQGLGIGFYCALILLYTVVILNNLIVIMPRIA
jgi:hypothetical protein